MSSPSHSLLPLNFFIVLFTFPHHSSSLLIIPCNVHLMLCFSCWNVLCLRHYLALHTLPSVIAVKQLHVKKFHSHLLIIDYDNQSKHDMWHITMMSRKASCTWRLRFSGIPTLRHHLILRLRLPSTLISLSVTISIHCRPSGICTPFLTILPSLRLFVRPY